MHLQKRNMNLRAKIARTLRVEASWLLVTMAIVIVAMLGRWRFDPIGFAHGLVFGGYTLILCVVLALVIRRKTPSESVERRSFLESVLLIVYLAIYIGLVTMLRNEQDNLFMIWALLVAVPAVFFLWLRKHSLGTIGLDRQYVLRGFGVAVIAGLLWLPLLLYANYLDSEPGKALISDWEGIKSLVVLLVSFVMAFLFAGFPEEFFFRGVLQESLLRIFQRPLRAILASASLFAVYHLPFAFFVPIWDSHDNLGFSLALVMTSQFFSGLLFGVVHWKSKSLVAPVLLHTLIDTFVLYSSARININIGS